MGREWLKRSSLTLPANPAVAGVLQKDTTVGQLLTDAVGGCKVARLARRLALGDECLDFGVAGRRFGFHAERTQLRRVIIGKHDKDRVEFLENALHRRDVALPEFAAVHGGVDLADQVEYGSQRLRGIEIVFETLLE